MRIFRNTPLYTRREKKTKTYWFLVSLQALLSLRVKVGGRGWVAPNLWYMEVGIPRKSTNPSAMLQPRQMNGHLETTNSSIPLEGTQDLLTSEPSIQ